MPDASSRAVTVDITQADLVAAQRLIMWDNYRNRRKMTVMVLLWLALSVFLFMLFRNDLPASATLAFAIVASIAGGAAFVVPALIVLLLGGMAARRNLRAVPAFREPLRYSWSDEGLTCETVSGHSLTRWSGYRRWRENDRLMLVWPHPLTYQLLPKRAFSSGQIAEIRGFLSAAAGSAPSRTASGT